MQKRSRTGTLILTALAALAITGCPGTTTSGQSGEKQIVSFEVTVDGEVRAGSIDETNHTVSLTLPAGTDVTALAPLVTVSEKATLSPASGTARDFTAPVTYTVTAEDGSAQEYTATVTVLGESPAADRAALDAAIATAAATKAGIAVDTAAANVPAGTQWVDQAALDALNAAIAAAEAVSQNADATQDQMDGALAALNVAVLAFNAAKQEGTKAGPTADKTALNAAIATAAAAKEGIAVDTDAANVPAGTQWVTQAAKDTFDTAIAAAEAVAQNAAATQEQADAAETALNTAITAFNTAKQAGTKAEPADDKTLLNAAIATATAARAGIVVDTDAANVPAGTQWVAQAAKDTFDGAITEAETVAQNAAASQEQVNAAETALNTAITAFNAAKQAGTKTEPADITYTLSVDGESDAADSTTITFDFSAAVTGLAAEHITLTGNGGAAVRGTLGGEGQTRTLGITVQTAGQVKVRVTKAGIEGAEKLLTVHKAPALSLTNAIEFASEEYSSGTAFDDSQWTGTGTATESWVLSTVAEQHLTYFAVYKEAAQTIAVGGTDAAAVSMAETGTTVAEATDEGLTAGDTLAPVTYAISVCVSTFNSSRTAERTFHEILYMRGVSS